MDLRTVDLDAARHIRPGARLAPYFTFGLGYAQASLDRPVTGTLNGQAVTIDDDSGMTANVGGGIPFFATKHLIVRGDARDSYINALVDKYDNSLNTVETTVGIGWRF